MKTLADVKRRAQVGTTLVMEKYVVNGRECAGKIVGVPRKIISVHSSSIQFAPVDENSSGSWLYWPKAKDVRIIDEDRFVTGGDMVELHYRFITE